jgi:hypothetical protein
VPDPGTIRWLASLRAQRVGDARSAPAIPVDGGVTELAHGVEEAVRACRARRDVEDPGEAAFRCSHSLLADPGGKQDQEGEEHERLHRRQEHVQSQNHWPSV